MSGQHDRDGTFLTLVRAGRVIPTLLAVVAVAGLDLFELRLRMDRFLVTRRE